LPIEKLHETIARVHKFSLANASTVADIVTGGKVEFKKSSKRGAEEATDEQKASNFIRVFSHPVWAVSAANHLAFHPQSVKRFNELQGLERQFHWLADTFKVGAAHALSPSQDAGIYAPFRLAVTHKSAARAKPEPREEPFAFDFDLRNLGKKRLFTLKFIDVGDLEGTKATLEKLGVKPTGIKSRKDAVKAVLRHVVPILRKHVTTNQVKFSVRLQKLD